VASQTSSRRTFGLHATATLAGLAPLLGCARKAPRVPTRASPEGELLETEDGLLSIAPDDPQQGPKTAHCVVVVFSDFQCPFCREVAEALGRLRSERPRDVRVVFKHLPIPSHPKARAAAVASQVVFLEAGSDAFWRFHDRCFSNPHELETPTLTAWARDEGVRADAIVERGPHAEKIVGQHVDLAERLGIRGTPRLYINARRVPGAYPYEQLREWVDGEL
jgi:protein-disulfide isomerase